MNEPTIEKELSNENAVQSTKEQQLFQDFKESAGDCQVSTQSIKTEEQKIEPEIIETLEFLIQKVEFLIQIEKEIPQLSILKDDPASELTVPNQDIIQLVDEIIQKVEHALKLDTPAEPNIPQLDEPVISSNQDPEIKVSSNRCPPEGLKKGTEIKDLSRSLPPEKPLSGLNEIKEIRNSQTDVPQNQPAPLGTTLAETLGPLKDNYIFKGLLGKGGFGEVYHLCHKLTKEEVAIKIVQSSKVTVSETNIWPNLDHPKILTLMEQHQFGEHHIFISPKQETRLQDIRYTVPFKDIKQYMLDALSGLEYLHHLGMCHLDIKADNILIGKHGAVLCDFGFVAKSKGLINKDFSPPIFYRPPEASVSNGIMAKIPDGKAVDLWEFGVMMSEIFMRSPLVRSKVQGKNWKKTTYPILRKSLKRKNFKNCFKENFPEVDKNTRRAALDIIHAFLHSCPHSRLSAKKAQNHPFFKNPVPKYFIPYPKDFSLW
ncbi:hypothetical protein JTE90_026959 [Oedothorax gibbosus]|uniref:Protein kinase domain-containing protein n=1 Tax=Oedothorax gibbosus TaxID=931172 RepID=A0AAV6UWZ0_9ARAC|nr:hypothetical protein JTE90_026959 [Oedothorax gibbosus]